jgi:hypothetical protein
MATSLGRNRVQLARPVALALPGIRALNISLRPLTVLHILHRVLLPLLQVATFALHLVICLIALTPGNRLAFPGQFSIVLLNL